MADIVGTSGVDTLNGTTGDDNITGLAGNDTLNGDLGNDTLDGGTGTDILDGGEGNDTLLTNGVDSGDQFNGGNGIDTIRLLPSAFQVAGLNGLISNYFLTAGAVSSIEKVDFSTSGGANNQFIAAFSQFGSGFSSNLEVIGSAGGDSVIITVQTAGTYTIPTITRTNWTTNTSVGGVSDIVGIFASGSGAFTLNANTNHTGLEVLQGAAGNDTLNGSNGQEAFVGTAGTDIMNGSGGDDIFAFANPAMPQNGIFQSYSGTTANGGIGTDILSFSGYVNFQGHFTSIETIRLVPEVIADATHIARPATYLDIDSNFGDQLLGPVTFEGTGTVGYSLLSGDTAFDGAQVVFAPGSNLTLELFGSLAGDTLVGTSTADWIYGDEGNDTIQGGLGDDNLDGEDGNDTLTGGAGADSFGLSLGQDIVTDFIAGTDKIDVSGAIGSFKTLQPFMSQVGNNVVFSFTEGGIAQTTTLQNVSLASLNASSFVFGATGTNIETGTASNDTLFGSTSGDTLDGGAGNDLIITGGVIAANGGTTDNIQGGDGDDIIIINNSLTVPGNANAAPANIYNGGTGTDTLRIVSFDNYTSTAPVNLSQANFAASAISGIEKIELASVAGERNTAIFSLNQANSALASATVSGGTGGDIVVFVAPNAAGDYSMPNLTRLNWSLDQSTVTNSSTVLNNDVFILSTVGDASFTLRANANHAGMEMLIGANGNDTLFGGNDSDILNGGIGGADVLNSGGGNDLLVVTQLSNQGNYANDLFDGGTGTDFLAVNGNVSFAGTLTSVEGIQLAPAVPAQGAAPALGNGQLTMDSTTAQQFGANVQLKGIGTVILNQAAAGTLNLSGWQFLSDPITIQINGSAQADILAGTGRGDTLIGGAGDDVLDGGSGSDLIDGGAGNDRIYWDAADGAANIFGGTGIDKLVVRDGVALPNFDFAARGFELLEIETNDNANNQAWSRQTQTYNLALQLTDYSTLSDDGSHVDVSLDPGNANGTSQVVRYYDTLDRLVQVDQVNDDASRVISNYDPANASALASQSLYFDSQGRFDLWDQLYDDGRHVIINYDQANVDPLSSEIIYYDAQARLDLWDRYFDDGSHQVINYDQANVEALSSELITYDTQGRLDLWDRYLDDGSRVLINYDQANATAFSVDLVYYDSQSRIDIWDQNYDNGSRVVIDYDQANATALSSSLVYYDALSHLDRWDQNYDNGSRVVIDYDQANASSLSNELLYFDTQGRTDLWDRNYDDGSRILVDFDQDNAQSWNQHVLLYNPQGTITADYFV